jgi:hypothetical protein
MADHVFYTDPGAGKLFATNEAGGVHYQHIKLTDGTPGASGHIPGDSTYGLRVNVSRMTPVSGDVGHDDINSGAPVQIGELGYMLIDMAYCLLWVVILTFNPNVLL